ncbi:MAG: hypothetical protein FWC97_04380 [Treponema sp.]|nr:hypothetical protein [Treponema sp.]
MKKIWLFFVLVFLAVFNSCIGLSMDIQMNRDGSGRLTFEYRVSNALGNLGLLDGNENWPTIPVGRADWERSIERINGASLGSFSSRNTGQDTVTTVVINFDNVQTLLEVVDPFSERVSIVSEGNTNVLSLILTTGSEDLSALGFDPQLMALAQIMFLGYDFSVSFSAHENSTMIITDGEGNAATPPALTEVVTSGRRVSMTIPMMDLIEIQNGLGVSFRW